MQRRRPHTFLKDVTDFASRSTTTSMGLDFGGSVSTTCTCKNLRYSRLRQGNVGQHLDDIAADLIV